MKTYTFAQRTSQMLKDFLPGFKWTSFGPKGAYTKWQDGCFYLYPDRLLIVTPRSSRVLMDVEMIFDYLMSFRLYLTRPAKLTEQTIN